MYAPVIYTVYIDSDCSIYDLHALASIVHCGGKNMYGQSCYGSKLLGGSSSFSYLPIQNYNTYLQYFVGTVYTRDEVCVSNPD